MKVTEPLSGPLTFKIVSLGMMAGCEPNKFTVVGGGWVTTGLTVLEAALVLPAASVAVAVMTWLPLFSVPVV